MLRPVWTNAGVFLNESRVGKINRAGPTVIFRISESDYALDSSVVLIIDQSRWSTHPIISAIAMVATSAR